MKQTSLFEQPSAIDGAGATFENSKDEPVHGWYPYLEGYSAAFVEALHDRLMPHARRVIDPFAGTGTTLIALGQKGIQCGYCEVNPVMQRVISTKVACLLLSPTEKRRTASTLDLLALRLGAAVKEVEPDPTLAGAYRECFGNSVFFEPEAFDTVCRFRALVDRLAAQRDSITGELVALAVLSNLVSCSLLKRAGDVRYRTKKELRRGVPSFVPATAAQLRRLTFDLRHMSTEFAAPRFIAADAKCLDAVPSFEVDGVITSPPYLNGTNYIRNTKLELWFLREIKTGADLRRLRDRMVTAGINDVVVRNGSSRAVPEVQEVVEQIADQAYDRRIPQMVDAYFADMQRVLEGLHVHCRPGAVLCIDLGDSRYGGVSVPTPSLLVAVAKAVGFDCVERIPLRERRSKDRTLLSQEVLVLKRRANGSGKIVAERDLRARWAWFKDNLPHQQEPYTKRNWGHPLHSACSYQGKMKPSLAHFLVHSFTRPGSIVLDPFAGAGTIPFEAALQSRRAIAFDISVMGVAVTTAKLVRPDEKQLDVLVGRLLRQVKRYRADAAAQESASAIRFNRSIPEYFHRETLREILAARAFMQKNRDFSPEWSYVMTALLHILHGNRPYALSRRSHPVTPFAPTGPTEYRSLAEKLTDKINRSLATPLPATFVPGRCYLTDVLQPWPADVNDVDAIVTSPPFFDSTRFYMSNWMRYWFCGWEKDDFAREPGRFIETLQRRDLDVYEDVFRQFRKHLSPNGVVVMHLGQSRKCDMGRELASRAEKAAFAVEELFREDVTHCEKHGLSDKGTVTAHQYLVLTPR
jgi:tRNA G10  N-methylase Trm11